MGQYERQRHFGYKAPLRDYIKLGRNDKCLCGSGKKYKLCCLPNGFIFRRKQKDEILNEAENQKPVM